MNHEEYISFMKEKCDKEYEIASLARSKGIDPKNYVEIPQAEDLADRTQKLLDFLRPRNTAEQIRQLNDIHEGNREMVAIEISKIVAAESYLYGNFEKCPECKGKGIVKQGWREKECPSCKGATTKFTCGENRPWNETLKEFDEVEDFDNPIKISISCYHGVCAGLAVLTEGILVAPLEGVVSATIIQNENGTNCLNVSFAGPIRSAGGTGQALSVLIADILRRRFNLAKALITTREIERYKEEVSIYARGLQYRPSNPQLEIIAKNCPIYLDGEGVGKEVSGQRDLPRVKSNKVREGAVLVMCEGLVLKAPKILKYTNALKLDGWDWLSEFIQENKEQSKVIEPSYKFLGDVLAGRPILGLPMQQGGMRLRYGRSRLGGLATTSIHPATMRALSGFLITGTQMKYERPGKATVVTPCETIDGPYVEFKDGTARRIINETELPIGIPIDAEWPIRNVWDLGELLIPVGEFIENNHPIIPSPYVSEWHKKIVKKYPKNFLEALNQSRENNIPMAPEYVAHFSLVSASDIKILLDNIKIDLSKGVANIPEEYLEIAYKINVNVGLKNNNYFLYGDKISVLLNVYSKNKLFNGMVETYKDGFEYISKLCDYEIKCNVTSFVGGRMGKPEGAKLREMKPKIHSLFPVGHDVGNQRKIYDAIVKESKTDIGIRHCEICDEETIFGVCCGKDTNFIETKYKKHDIKSLWDDAKIKLDTYVNEPIKGVKGMISSELIPENLGKGFIRYKNNLSVFRDGTTRFDMVDISMTHFKPSEIGLSLEKAQKLGYDVNSVEEVVELKIQDIVLSLQLAEQLLDTTKYIDEMLVKLYDMKPFYNCVTVDDLFGQLMMGLAPHTSGAILCRIIGLSDIKGHYGHPFFHAAKRRNCDGDIDCVMFLLDGLINFSKDFLSTFRGGQMDAPLILTTSINPSEIDKEALNLDIGWEYPVKFYEWSQETPLPKDASKYGVLTVDDVLGSDKQYEGFGYTHETIDCNSGPRDNPYNTLDSMRMKTMVQFALGTTLTSVDNNDQASRLIDRHLIRDMRGNLRAFGQQKVRCTKCGESYRRPPLSGNCVTIIDNKIDPFSKLPVEITCPGNIILTVSKGSVSKYDSLMAELIEKYGCNDYTNELYHLISSWVAETFRVPNTKKQDKLWD